MAGHRGTGPQPETDWLAISLEYICGTDGVTQASLAKKYNLPKDTVARACRVNGWGAKRARYRKKAFEQALEKSVKKDANRMAKLITAADDISATIAKVCRDSKQFNRHLVKNAADETVERIFDKADTRALRDLSGAIKDMVGVMQALYDKKDPTQEQEKGGVIVLADVDEEGA